MGSPKNVSETVFNYAAGAIADTTYTYYLDVREFSSVS